MNIQTEKYLEPIREINTLALESAEKMLDIQLKSINDTARIGVAQLRNAAEIKDAEGFKDYLSGQTEVAKNLSERFVKDTQATLELGASYADQVQQVFTKTVRPETARPEAGRKAAPRAKQTQE